MSKPLEIGGRYSNRNGKYDVLTITGDDVTVRYLNGETRIHSRKILERIWLRIQEQERNPPPPPPPPSGKTGGKKVIISPDPPYNGLSDSDFQKGITGTHWRARDSVGGAVARRLTGLAGRPFQSYAIYRRAEVHIADPNRYDDTNKFPEAKFVIYLDHECARYGFYVEKRDKPMDEKWDWLCFLVALKGQELQRKIWLAARERNLHWEIDVHDQLVGWIYVWPKETELLWIWQEGEQKQVISWGDLLAKLDAINGQAERWCDLYIVESLSKEDALAEKAGIVERMTRVYGSLLPVYEACSK